MTGTTVMALSGNGAIAFPAWMSMCGERGPEHIASSVGMWSVMTAAMMLPILVPMLHRYRASRDVTDPLRLGALTLLTGMAYLSVWLLAAPLSYALSVALAAATLRGAALAHAARIGAAGLVVLAGTLQFTSWKARRLACCRAHSAGAGSWPSDARSAWRHGIQLGLRCGACCGNLMVAAAVAGMMDGWMMTVVTIAIVAERFGRYRALAVRITGAALMAGGVMMIAQALGRGP